jgi:hypothetical protein
VTSVAYEFLSPPTAEEQFLDKLAADVHLTLRSQYTFDGWLRVTEQNMVRRAVIMAWERFKDEVEQLVEPQPWVAVLPVSAWAWLPLEERSTWAGRLQDTSVIVEGKGEPPELLKAWVR